LFTTVRPPGPWRQHPRGQPPRCRPHARLDLASVDAPRVRPRCPRLPSLSRPAARYRQRPEPPRRPGHPRPPSRLWGPRAARPCPTRLGRNRVDSSLDQPSKPHSRPPAPAPWPPARAAAQGHWGPAGALDADPRLRPLERAVSGPPPGLTGEAGLPRRRPPRGGGVNRS